MLRTFVITVLLFLASLPVLSQNRVSADAEVKKLLNGKVTTVTKREFCKSDGRMVTVFTSPDNYIMTTNLDGEMVTYSPARNEAFKDRGDEYSTIENLIFLFLSGRSADLGLTSLGYALATSSTDGDGYLKRTYTTRNKGAVPRIDIVLKDFLPVYVAYMDHAGAVVSKTYLSGYDLNSRFVFPARVTAIDYLQDRDSSVTRTLYSNIKVNSDEPEFSFELPSDAVRVNNPFKH
ncbi:MAG: hypothetical protein IJS30_02255 [Bacteroidales bacterium]|nr:hypothetical protein [Bacteroidales bacterium]